MLVNVINYLDFIKKELYDNNIGEYMETKLEDKKGLNNNLKFGIICLGITIVIAIIMIIIFSNKKGENGEILLLENVKTIYVGEKKKIKVHVSNSSDAILNYKSADENIIKVDNDVIEGVSIGKTSIIISSDIKDVKSISVDIEVKDGGGILYSISYPLGELVIGTNKTFDLNDKITYNPSNGIAHSKTFISSNPTVATISEYGVLTTKKTGTTNITTNVNNRHDSTITVFVISDDNPGEIIRNTDKIVFKENDIKIKKGDTKKIEYDVYPKDSSMKYVSINVEDKNIVSINEDIIKGLNVGKTSISYKTIDNKEYKVNIEVMDDVKILNDEITMEIDTTKDINIGIDDKDLKVSSSDLAIASAEYKDKVLKISAKKVGTAIINIENANKDKETIKVNVVNKNTPVPTPNTNENKDENRGYTVTNLYSTKDLALNSSIKVKEEISFNITDDKIKKLLVCWTDENGDCDPLTEINTVKPITRINNKLYLNNPKMWKVKVLELDSDNKAIKDVDVYYVNVI